MEFFVPSYYSSFRCIADKCKHSCCIGWDIPIDGKTIDYYDKIASETVGELSYSIMVNGDQKYIKMRADGRCPILTDNGLCKLICELGNEAICDTCKRHPRFINVIDNMCEVGLGISCEEACRLILLYDKPVRFVSLPELSSLWYDIEDTAEEALPFPYTAISDREDALKIVDSCDDISEIQSLLSARFSVSTDIHTEDEWIEIFLGLECLDSEWKELLSAKNTVCNTDFPEKSLMLKNLMRYLIFRHTTEAEYYDDFRARLGFCMLGVYVVSLLFARNAVSDKYAALEIARKFSAEIEYSEENTDELIFEFECRI